LVALAGDDRFWTCCCPTVARRRSTFLGLGSTAPLLRVRSRPSRPEQPGHGFGNTPADEVASAESTTRIADTGRRGEARTVRRASGNDVAHVKNTATCSTANNRKTSGPVLCPVLETRCKSSPRAPTRPPATAVSSPTRPRRIRSRTRRDGRTSLDLVNIN
jgi:hypothetical protein